jgi:hypothetical protein
MDRLTLRSVLGVLASSEWLWATSDPLPSLMSFIRLSVALVHRAMAPSLPGYAVEPS